jgi:hypothetical protein
MDSICCGGCEPFKDYAYGIFQIARIDAALNGQVDRFAARVAAA